MKVVTRGKRFTKIRDRVRRRNRRFRRMSKQDQRITIARDVIATLAVTSVVFQHFGYFNIVRGKPTAEAGDLEAAEVFEQIQCSACAVGSMFVAAVRHHDDLKFDKVDQARNGSMRCFEARYLSKWFDSRQLDMIEGYFEQSGPYWRLADNASPISMTLGRRDRMRMIMENIVSNRGKFDPKKGTHRIPVVAS